MPSCWGVAALCSTSLMPANSHCLCAPKTSLSPFCLLVKANSVPLPSLAAAVLSPQRGDRTDGPKLGTKAVLMHPALAPGKTELGTEGERDCTQLGLTRFISLSVLQVAEVGQSQDSN